MSLGAVQHAKVDVAIRYEQRADVAASAVLRRLLEVIGDNREGALAGEDPEYLHQLRIAVRRSRTVQRQFRDVFPALELPGFRSELRWLQRATGECRDLDVELEEFDALRDLVPKRWRGDLEPMRRVLAQRRVVAGERLGSTLRSARLGELCADWERLLESLVELPLEDRPAATRSIGSLTGERVLAVYDTMLELGPTLEETGPAEPWHELRKKGKELRYLLELFGARLFDPDLVGSLVSVLKGLQDLLGRHQDREVQVQLVGSLVDEVAALPGGPAGCLAMGVLADRLALDELAARREFPACFAALADPERHRQLSEGLGRTELGLTADHHRIN